MVLRVAGPEQAFGRVVVDAASSYDRQVDVVSQQSDGGAVLRLSDRELVGYYNLLNTFLALSTTQELVWAERGGQLEQVRVLAGLIGMPPPSYATDATLPSAPVWSRPALASTAFLPTLE